MKSTIAIFSLVAALVLQFSAAAQTNAVGNPSTFTVQATGTAPLSYQWKFNGTNVSAAAPAVQRQKDYDNAIQNARQKYALGDYAGAIAQADLALAIKPSDAAALKLKNDAAAQQAAAAAAAQRQKNYENAMQTGQAKLAAGDYAAAILQTDLALANKPNDAAALKLKNDAASQQAAASAVHVNTAIVPVSRTGSATNRQSLVLERAKEHPGDYDIEFIGDSITQGWEGSGKQVWQEFYGKRKVINMGVGGDRTQHVLWRFEQGQLDGIHAKVAVVMIGTNNSNKDDNTEAGILAGVTAIVDQIRQRQPDTKIILLGIFPRGQTFSTQRGKILQVNEALARLDDGKNIFYMDIGPQLIENDGSISRSMMRDYLHPGADGYKIWANAMEPKIRQLLRKKHWWQRIV